MARKKLETLTEQMFYVLLALREERHGYGIMQAIAELTGGRVSVGAGTLYALLERFEKDGLIRRTRTEDNRKYYILMPEGERTETADRGESGWVLQRGNTVFRMKDGALPDEMWLDEVLSRLEGET